MCVRDCRLKWVPLMCLSSVFNHMVNLSAVASATTTATSSTKIVALWIKRDPLRDRSFFLFVATVCRVILIKWHWYRFRWCYCWHFFTLFSIICLTSVTCCKSNGLFVIFFFARKNLLTNYQKKRFLTAPTFMWNSF